jgi:broad specificity phosphatase PhoE
MELWLVRHGESTWNSERRFQGRRDAPLSAHGRIQAAAVAERLRAVPVDGLYTSPLARARETAAACAAALGRPAVVVEDLCELGLGAWEGCTLESVRTTAGDGYRRWVAAPLDHTPPGGEALSALAARVARAIEALPAGGADGRVVLVSHGGAIASVLCGVLGLSLNALWRFRLDNGSITRLRWAPPRVLAVNETAHLPASGNGRGSLWPGAAAGSAP